MENKISSIDEAFRFEETLLERRNIELHAEQRKRGGHFYQGRHFRIETVVGVFPAHVAGEEMMPLVPRDGVASRRECQLQREEGKQQDNPCGYGKALWRFRHEEM